MPEANEILEILKYVLPSLVVFATAWILLKIVLESNIQKLRLEQRQQVTNQITPIKLQAYERVVLFLERISPESMLVRIQTPGQNVKQFQQQLLSTIRQEFEHNLSQQLYLSEASWVLVKTAKENIIRLVNAAAANIDPKAPAIELSKVLLHFITKAEKSPMSATIDAIKKEFSEMIG